MPTGTCSERVHHDSPPGWPVATWVGLLMLAVVVISVSHGHSRVIVSVLAGVILFAWGLFDLLLIHQHNDNAHHRAIEPWSVQRVDVMPRPTGAVAGRHPVIAAPSTVNVYVQVAALHGVDAADVAAAINQGRQAPTVTATALPAPYPAVAGDDSGEVA